MNLVNQYLEELEVITREANNPSANMATFEELRAKLKVSDTLGISKEQLELPLKSLNGLQERIDKVKIFLRRNSNFVILYRISASKLCKLPLPQYTERTVCF